MSLHRNHLRAVSVVLGAALFVIVGSEPADTHKLVSSKYTYNRDIFTVLRQRCGRCHWSGGIAPMSLMSYADARAWGESLRAELIPAHMPPWNIVDNVGAFKNAQTITAAETDAILTWATGGTPEGDPASPPPAVSGPPEWPLGRPDLVLSPHESVTLAAGVTERDVEFTLPIPGRERRWIRAIDVLPGTPAIVRNVSVFVRSDGGDDSDRSGAPPESLLALWVPGDEPVRTERGTAFELPPDSTLIVRVHYRKTYQNSNRELSDRTSIGLYFGGGRHAAIRQFAIPSPPLHENGEQRLVFGRTVGDDLELLAFVPDPTLSNARVEVAALSPDGGRLPIVHLAARAGWARRYWFDEPLALKKGMRVEVALTLNAADHLLPPAASPLPPQQLTGAPVRIAFDVVTSDE
jgi:hypothetical protein